VVSHTERTAIKIKVSQALITDVSRYLSLFSMPNPPTNRELVMHETKTQHYPLNHLMTDHQILERASEIIASKFIAGDAFTDAKTTKEYFTFKLAIMKVKF